MAAEKVAAIVAAIAVDKAADIAMIGVAAGDDARLFAFHLLFLFLCSLLFLFASRACAQKAR